MDYTLNRQLIESSSSRWSNTNNRYDEILTGIQLVAGSLSELIDQRTEQGKTSHVLELFGPGGKNGKSFMRKATSWTGITLDGQPNTHARMISANLFDTYERYRVETLLDSQPDIILCNPIGPFGLEHVKGVTLSEWDRYFQEFYAWCYNLLPESDGILISQLMYFFPADIRQDIWYTKYRRYLEVYTCQLGLKGISINIPGLDSDLPLRCLLMRKTPNSPKRLEYVNYQDLETSPFYN